MQLQVPPHTLPLSRQALCLITVDNITVVHSLRSISPHSLLYRCQFVWFCPDGYVGEIFKERISN